MYIYTCVIYIYTYTNTYIHIHTHIIYRWNKKTMEKNLVLYSKVKRNQPDRCRFYNTDMDNNEAVSVERLFISLSKFQVPRGGVILCHVRLCKLAKNRKWTCFWCYTQSCYKPLTNLYSSVARTSIFLWCTETELSISKR